MNPDPTLESTQDLTARQESAIATAAPSKFQQQHFERTAIVYVRQSTAQQVLHHRESAIRHPSVAKNLSGEGFEYLQHSLLEVLSSAEC